tara:strand:+ start:420 stop:608 length:189 start_codon:yes stop_codon:yes gene_type:complete
MKYNGIKNVLRSHIKDNLNTIWQWDIEDNHFILTFNEVDNDLPIYTPTQLLAVLMDLKETPN